MEAIALAVLPRDAPEDSDHSSSAATLETGDGMDHLSTHRVKLHEPYFFAPLSHSPHTPLLVDRELKHLEQKLSNLMLEGQSICLYGPLGSGKARLMEHYICQNCTRFRGGIFWINYRSRQEILRSLEYIIQTYIPTNMYEKDYQDLPFEHAMRTVEAWLYCKTNWLVVLNDVPEEWESQLAPIFYPQGRWSSLIYIASHDKISNLPSKKNVIKIDPVQIMDEFSPFMAHIADADKKLTMGVLPPVRYSWSPSHDNPCWIVLPSARRNDYISLNGREEELRLLESKLFGGRRAYTIDSVQLHGPPDCGISDIVRHYIDKNRSHFSGGIFWIDAKTSRGLHQCLWRIAMMVGECSESDGDISHINLVKRIENWLEQRSYWLLVFDMLPDVDPSTPVIFPFSVRRMYPKSGRSSIIYMSNKRFMYLPFDPFPIEIKPLTRTIKARKAQATEAATTAGNIKGKNTFARTGKQKEEISTHNESTTAEGSERMYYDMGHSSDTVDHVLSNASRTNEELFDDTKTTRLMQSLLCEHPGCNRMFASISDYT